MLGNLLNIEAFEYNSSEEIRDEVTRIIDNVALGSLGDWSIPESLEYDMGSDMASDAALQKITEIPMYRIDAMTRRAQALQDTGDCTGSIQINSGLANSLHISAGDTVVVEYEENTSSAPVMINERVSDDCVLVQAAQLNHADLGAWYGHISLRKA